MSYSDILKKYGYGDRKAYAEEPEKRQSTKQSGISSYTDTLKKYGYGAEKEAAKIETRPFPVHARPETTQQAPAQTTQRKPIEGWQRPRDGYYKTQPVSDIGSAPIFDPEAYYRDSDDKAAALRTIRSSSAKLASWSPEPVDTIDRLMQAAASAKKPLATGKNTLAPVAAEDPAQYWHARLSYEHANKPAFDFATRLAKQEETDRNNPLGALLPGSVYNNFEYDYTGELEQHLIQTGAATRETAPQMAQSIMTEAREKLHAPKQNKRSWLDHLGTAGANFVNQAGKFAGSTLNLAEQATVGNIVKFAWKLAGASEEKAQSAKESLPIHMLYEDINRNIGTLNEQAEADIAGMSNDTEKTIARELYDLSGQLGSSAMFALTAIMSWAAGGAKAVEGIAGAAPKALEKFAQMQANPGVVKTLSNAMWSMVSRPDWFQSFALTFGTDFEEAKEDGANDFEAITYAIGNGILNATVEVGGDTGNGGLQSVPEKAAKWKALNVPWLQQVKNYIKDVVLQEGGEEVAQGIIQRLMQNLVYNKGNPILPNTGDAEKDADAVFNPSTAWQEFKGGAVGALLLGTAQSKIVQLAQYGRFAQAGKEIANALPKELRGVATQALIDNALSMPEGSAAYEYGEKVAKKFQKDGAISDAALGRLYWEVENAAQIFGANKGAETAPEAPTRTAPQQTVSVPVMEAIDQVMDGERVTNRVADEILQDEEAVAYLQSEAGFEITDGMTNSQKREAVRTAVNSLVGTMNITAQENGAQTTQETPATQENRTPAQQVADIGQTLNLGTNGMTALTEQYDGESDPMEYARAMTVVYNAGEAVASGETYNEAAAQEAFGKLTEAQQTAAWKAGINDAKEALATEAGAEYDNNINNEVTEGTTYGQGDTGYREGRVRSQRNDAAQQGEEVAGGAAQAGGVDDQGGVAEAAGGGRKGDAWSPRRGKTPEARNLVYGREITDSELGVKTDPSAPKVRAVTSGETSAMKRANSTMKRVGELIGAKVRSLFFGGSDLSIVEKDGSVSRNVEAFSQAWRNFVALPADHPGITVDRFAGHEGMEELLSHGVVKLNDVVDDVRDIIGDDVFDEAVGVYRSIYHSDDTAHWTKEFICDGAGNINRQTAYVDVSDSPLLQARAQLLDVVLETIHNHLNEITDGAFSDVPPLDSQMTDDTDVPSDQATQHSTPPVSDEDYLSAAVDSYGVVLSEAQQEYFKDSKARDEDGRLLVLYHGGMARGENGNAFAGRGKGYTYNPNAIFLTDSKEVARAFAGKNGRLYELYADVRKPLILDAEGRSYTDIPISDDAPQSLKDYFMMTETADADNLTVYAEEHGYDGVIIKNVREGVGGDPMTEVIALRPAQVKNTDNAEPTKNPDIRYSTGVATDEDYAAAVESENYRAAHDMLLSALEQKMQQSKVRDKDGKLLRMYHGTDADFTEFDRSKIGSTGRFEGSGFNFTPYEGRAAAYGGRVLTGYLNIRKPLNAERKTFSVNALANLIRSVDPTGDNIIANYADDTRDYGSPSFIRRESLTTARKIWDFSDNDVDIYSELSAANPDAEGLIDAFSKLGYDGLIHYDDDGIIKTAVAFSSSQFKLDDPDTYDDKGKPIPLSKRVNLKRDDIRFSTGAVAAADDGAPSSQMAWALDQGLLSKQDQGAFWSAINAHRRHEYLPTIDGLYIVEQGNTIMLTNGNFDHPSLPVVVKLNGTAEEINTMKGIIEGAGRKKQSLAEAVRTIQLAFGEGRAISYHNGSGRSYGRQDGRREGTDRRGSIGENEGLTSGRTGQTARSADYRVKGNQFSTGAATDEEYLAAVDRGDMEEAQKMVDEAAKAAGYDSPKLYHGTPTFGFTEFDPKASDDGIALFFTTSPTVARTYAGAYRVTPVAEKDTAKAGIYALAGTTKGMLVVDAKGSLWRDIPLPEEIELAMPRSYYPTYENLEDHTGTTRMLARFARDAGYYGLIVQNVIDEGGNWKPSHEKSDVYVYFDSNAVKSLDPVTYDDDGNVIPLSERFNPNKPDVRHSVAPPVTERTVDSILARKLEQARKRAAYWKGQTKTTTKALTKVAQDAIKTYNSTVKASNLLTSLQSLARNIFRAGDTAVDYEAIQTEARDIARDIVNGAEILQGGNEDYFDDIRGRLKETRITISRADAETIEDYSNFRRHLPKYFQITTEAKPRKTRAGFFGLETRKDGVTTNVGELYDGLRTDYPWLFPEIDGAGAQLQKIAEVMQSLEPIYVNPYSETMADAIQWCANGIIDAITDEGIVPTLADRQEARLSAERQAGKEALAALRKASNERLRDALKEKQEDTQKRLAELRADRDKKLADLKQHHRDVAEDKRQRKMISEIGSSLLKIMRQLNRMHMSTENRTALQAIIGNYDLTSKTLTDAMQTKLQGLQDYLVEKKKDPNYIPSSYVENAVDRLYKQHIGDLKPADQLALLNVLKNFKHNLETQNQFISSSIRMELDAAASATIQNILNSKGNKKTIIRDVWVMNQLTPESAMHLFTGYVDDDPLYIATKDMSKGGLRQIDYQRRAYAIFDRFLKDDAFMDSISGSKAKLIKMKIRKVDGSEVEITLTPAMRISLYLASMNDKNLLHIRDGGVRIPDTDLYRKGELQEAMKRGTRVKLEPSTVRRIALGDPSNGIPPLSEKEKSFARAAWRYFNEFSSPEVAKTSEAMDGFARPMETNYFPIDSVGDFLKTDFASIKKDGTLSGVGWMKERVEGANSPIYLYDADFVVKKAIDAHSKYVGMLIPVRNFNKLWNASMGFYDENGKYEPHVLSVREAMGDKWGTAGEDYVDRMMQAVQFGGEKKTSIEAIMRKALSAYAGAVLTFTPGTAVMQMTSFPTAAYIVGWEPLAKAFRQKNLNDTDLKMIQAYTPILWYRTRGYIDPEFGSLTESGKAKKGFANMIQGADVLTTKRLWIASEYYVRDHFKGLEVGSPEQIAKGESPFYKKVAEVYEDVIRKTQPNYTPMERPQILKSNSVLERSLVMFATQRFQNFNILYDSLGKMRAEKTRWINTGEDSAKQAYEDAAKAASRAIWSQLAASFAFALVTAARDFLRGRTKKYRWRDKDLKDTWWWSVPAGLARNMLENGFGMFIFGNEIITKIESIVDAIAKGISGETIFDAKEYGITISVLETINDISDDINKLAEKTSALAADAIRGKDVNVEDLLRTTVGTAEDVGKITGKPVSNVKRLLEVVGNAVLKYAVPLLNPERAHLSKYYALRITVDPDKSKGEYYDLLYKAYESNAEDYRSLYDLMLKDGFTEKGIKNAMEKKMKQEQGVKSVKYLSHRYKAP